MIQSVPCVPGEDGNTKSSSPKKHWCFTFNNYTTVEKNELVQLFQHLGLYVIGQEIGENGTPHLQGYIALKTKKRLTALKKINKRIHWEPTRNVEASIEYCKKENNFITNIPMIRKLTFPTMDRPWQLEILENISKEPDERTINWYWSEEGNIGKTTFMKYLMVNHNAIAVPSKGADAMHALAKVHDQKKPIDLVVMNIPRDKLEYINYGTIETIKDGLLISGKYEGCSAAIACPHVYIFSNTYPNTDKISHDRWNIQEIY